MVSSTVTVERQKVWLPVLSVTIRVTLFAPRLLQLKLSWLAERVMVPPMS